MGRGVPILVSVLYDRAKFLQHLSILFSFHTKMYQFTGTGQNAPDKNASKFMHHSRIVGPQNSFHVTVL